MAYERPRRHYLVLLLGPPVIALLVWLTVREFETGTIVYKGLRVSQADSPIRYALGLSFSVLVTVGFIVAWCFAAYRIWRPRRNDRSSSWRQR